MGRTVIGEVDIRSGTLVVIDFGCLSLFGDGPEAIRESLGQAVACSTTEAKLGALAFVVVRDIPPGRYPISSEQLDEGEYEGHRVDAVVEIAPGDTARTLPLGTVLVDTARVGFFDLDVLPNWNEHEPVDGLADVAFWGRDEDAVAARFGVGRIAEGVYGVENRPLEDALVLGRALQVLRESRELMFAFDFRPHTHPFYLLAQMRSSATESGTIEVDGSKVCGLMTTWGDGWFPVELDVDADGKPLRVRIVFDTGESEA